MSESDITIEIERLSVQFGGRTVLHEIDLRVPTDGITVVIGPSGSGKTTLLRAVNRLNECFPQCRTSGRMRLRLDGEWVEAYADGYPVETLRRKAAMVFQNPNVLPTSIEKNFAVPLRSVLDCSTSEIRKRMERALREALLYEEVKDRLHDSALTLSGGQQQRLCLARALALEPAVLLLDEPTANLDFIATQKVEELLGKLKDRYSILAVSHSLGQTRRIADRVVVLREGKIAQTFEREHLKDAAVFQKLVEEVF